MDLSNYNKAQIGSAKLIIKNLEYKDGKIFISGDQEKTDAEALFIIKFLSDRYKYKTSEADITTVLNDWKTSKTE